MRFEFMRSICVYCGSSDPLKARFRDCARRLGLLIGQNGDQLVYGGGRVGLMGVVADATLTAGGRVIGIIPEHIQALEVGHEGLSELRVVDSMHTRKRMMFDLSDAFVVLPGGLGTLDETVEVVTWRQLGLHDKPIIVVNEDAYWDPLFGLHDHMIDHSFSRDWHRGLYTAVDTVEDVYAALRRAPEPRVPPRPRRL